MPTKEHVLFELERREEARISEQLRQFVRGGQQLVAVLGEAVRLA